MPFRRIAIASALSVSVACGSSGSSTPTSPTTTPTTTTPTTPTPVAPTVSWTNEGTRLTAAQAGQTSTQVLADATVIRLNDGRWRMYVYGNTAYKSAISSDGLAFTIESGFRMREGAGQSRAWRLDDGRIRIYFSANGISSAVSSDDGTTFIEESGTRLSASAAGMSQLTGPGIVRMRSGLYRMYFSDLPIPGEGVRPHQIKSATSADLVSWTMDSGVRVGTGATMTGNAEHPCAIVNSDGSVTIFYFRNTDFTLYQSTSSDGVTFNTEQSTGLGLNDPDIVTLSDGTVRLYGGGIDSGGGYIGSARRATANALGLMRSFAAPGTSGTTFPAPPPAPGGRATADGVRRGQSSPARH